MDGLDYTHKLVSPTGAASFRGFGSDEEALEFARRNAWVMQVVRQDGRRIYPPPQE